MEQDDSFTRGGALKGRLAAEFAEVLQRADAPGVPPPKRAGLAMELLAYGLVDKARSLVEGLPPTLGPRRARLLQLLDRIDAGERLLDGVAAAQRQGGRPGADVAAKDVPGVGRRLTGIVVAPQPHPATRAVLVFGGNASRDLPVSQPVAEIEDAHLILIKDPSRCFGLADIPRLGADFPQSVARLRRIQSALGATELYAIGFSAGGFAGMKFMLTLGGRGVLCFSSPSSLDLADEPGKTIQDYPQLLPLHNKAPHLITSMKREYLAAATHPSIIMVYGERHPRDRKFAEHMRDVPGVSLVPLSGHDQHASYAEAVQRGMVAELYQRLLGLAPVGTGAAAAE